VISHQQNIIKKKKKEQSVIGERRE